MLQAGLPRTNDKARKDENSQTLTINPAKHLYQLARRVTHKGVLPGSELM
jgi:hypothetical protein